MVIIDLFFPSSRLVAVSEREYLPGEASVMLLLRRRRIIAREERKIR